MNFDNKVVMFLMLWIFCITIFVLTNIVIHPREIALPEDRARIEQEFELIRNESSDCGSWGNKIVIANQGVAISSRITNCTRAVNLLSKLLAENNWQTKHDTKGRVYFCKDKYIAQIESTGLTEANLAIAVKYYRHEKLC